MNLEKIKELEIALRELKRSVSRLSGLSTRSVVYGSAASRSASESARLEAIEVRRLKHRAHVLCVELGFADLRSPEHYQDSTAPAGFGRNLLIERRAPNEQ